MIKIEKPDISRHCNACNRANNVVNILFENSSHQTQIALCDACLKELQKAIENYAENK